MRVRTLVIGYGNDLRGDDAAGQVVARTVNDWALPGVRALAVHQLVPELAEPVAAAGRVIFVDAYRATLSNLYEGECRARRRWIEPSDAHISLGHVGDPAGLLALAAALYGCDSGAWLITIPALDFSFGSDLSPITAREVAAALQFVRALVESEMSGETDAQGTTRASDSERS